MLKSKRDGFALITVILATTTISVLVAAFFAATSTDLASVRASTDGATGFYSAEAGLNIRGEKIRAVFQGYARPSGTSPNPNLGCVSGNLGSGHFACDTGLQLNSRTISTYVVEDPRNNDPNDSERMITIPPGERFAGLNAIQYRYSVISEAQPTYGTRPEAILEMTFRTRLVPLFQFATFYNKDLEILPGPNMTLGGPVHVNGDLYLNTNAGSTLSINGEITVARSEDALTGGGLWRGRKNDATATGTVHVDDADDATIAPDPAIPGTARRLVPQTELDAWNGRIETGLDALTVPATEEFTPGGMYWQQADLVVALDLRGGLGTANVIVPNRDISGGISPNAGLTALLNGASCPRVANRSYEIRTDHALTNGLPALPDRAVEWSNSFRDRRENATATARTARRLMLEVDVRALLNCMYNNSPALFADGPSTEDRIDDSSGGGLVWYFTVLGPNQGDASSGYGVRLRNGAALSSTIGGAPAILGLTIVSDQAVFVQGNYNLDANVWRPASVLADAINILSENYGTGTPPTATWQTHIGSLTNATATTVQAAFLGGTHTTGGQEGTPGQNGAYNGGLENYPIFHEQWGGVTFTYNGSFVSLENQKHSTGAWSTPGYYGAPNRNWSYDTRFNDVANLPPLSPRFVYLLQERFVREFTR